MITFYDLPSILPENDWSPNTWRTRLCLDYKGLDYKTEWVEFPDIAKVCQEQGIAATATWRDGSPYFSVPAIVDVQESESDTGFTMKRTALAESFEIAKYLDAAYPNTKRVIPEGADAERFQREFPLEFRKLVFLPFCRIFWAKVMTILNPVSRPYFTRARASLMFEKESLDEVAVKTDEEREKIWGDLREGLKAIDRYYKETDEAGPWMLGKTVSFADFVVVAFLVALKRVFGEESEEWRTVKGWDDGRWGHLLQKTAELTGSKL
ncbi:hypothetical protein CC1G_02842 [Coprinopsis cinerea okayama7|uniref:GST N-terminal domain-containing protein n=1 Tax=Coprinopsis cinerea (strain Okayama-7 / 130 / ATCC MYA-4618 / FGSC 9003) TaxID=240176 RepID=A8N073_COPC7|nr:hypothetical protein CC1G_02842 [Coprinopsis cinerea okayama7\|eukprot:XP_001828261.1 hypothetical protein CC1G_02842 [Coprinopsis cinerea okayama7\